MAPVGWKECVRSYSAGRNIGNTGIAEVGWNERRITGECPDDFSRAWARKSFGFMVQEVWIGCDFQSVFIFERNIGCSSSVSGFAGTLSGRDLNGWS